ncbi:MAG: putative membrane protein YvbJ [Alteromonadaceae bacterium]|jgi:uncharacterized membrane protein YvbJ
MNTCQKCYSHNEDTDQFCTSCGSALLDTAETSKPTTTTEKEPASKLDNISKYGIIFIVLFVISKLFGGNSTSDNASNEATIQLSNSQKVKICKAYLGKLFGRPTAIMNNNKNENGLIYINYIRSSDGSKWDYVCEIENNSLIWSGWMKDAKEWGRWREEDRTSISLGQSGDTISFFTPSTKEKVTIKFYR